MCASVLVYIFRMRKTSSFGGCCGRAGWEIDPDSLSSRSVTLLLPRLRAFQHGLWKTSSLPSSAQALKSTFPNSSEGRCQNPPRTPSSSASWCSGPTGCSLGSGRGRRRWHRFHVSTHRRLEGQTVREKHSKDWWLASSVVPNYSMIPELILATASQLSGRCVTPPPAYCPHESPNETSG